MPPGQVPEIFVRQPLRAGDGWRLFEAFRDGYGQCVKSWRICETSHSCICNYQDISLEAHGLCLNVLGKRATGLDSAFQEQFRSYCLHVGSDGDLWAALVSGCLLDRCFWLDSETEFAQGQRPYPYPILNWWEPSQPLPTLGRVLWEWRLIRAAMAGSVRAEGWMNEKDMDEVIDVVGTAVRTIDDYMVLSQQHAKSLIENRREVFRVMKRWIECGIDSPQPTLRIF